MLFTGDGCVPSPTKMAFKEIKSEAQNTWRRAKDNYTEKIFDPKEDEYEQSPRHPLKKF